jgi:hypothetical protein
MGLSWLLLGGCGGGEDGEDFRRMRGDGRGKIGSLLVCILRVYIGFYVMD